MSNCMVKCGDCEHFERGKWVKEIDENESEQFGGNCPLILRVFSVTNNLWAHEYFHVQEGFGCAFGQRKELK